MIMDKILTVNDVADVLKVKPITVREMLRTERIRGFKVGKAWRTTEKMLQEDIEKLSRGEAPEKLPKANGVAKHGVKPQKKAAAKAHKPGNGATGGSLAKADLTRPQEVTEQLLF